MVRAQFKGSITTTGRSEAIRLDKALFKAHPEFSQRAKIKAHVIGPGSLLVTLDTMDDASTSDDVERDPVVSAYLAFLEQDMKEHPDRLQPFGATDLAKITALTEKVNVSDDETIPDDVGL
ncbi:MAG: type II toxin-antitoxin system PrlF family antitoxin [Shinella sp.]|jgi:antitoxin PrlF|nr:type II toxin-antitoxin system PrlF family antitoxin [Shinella sp.]